MPNLNVRNGAWLVVEQINTKINLKNLSYLNYLSNLMDLVPSKLKNIFYKFLSLVEISSLSYISLLTHKGRFSRLVAFLTDLSSVATCPEIQTIPRGAINSGGTWLNASNSALERLSSVLASRRQA